MHALRMQLLFLFQMMSRRQYRQKMASDCILVLCLITINSVLVTESLATPFSPLRETPGLTPVPTEDFLQGQLPFAFAPTYS